MIDDSNLILAKSDSAPVVTLEKHINDGLLVISCLKNSFPSIGNYTSNQFWKNLQLSFIFHDLGKSHIEFQKVLRNKPSKWNHHRHELFSLPFVNGLKIPVIDKYLIGLVVAGHHKEFNALSRFLYYRYSEKDDDVFNSILNEELNTLENEFRKNINENYIKIFLKEKYNIILEDVEFLDLKKYINDYIRNPVHLNSNNFLELLLLFGAFKHCDHLASAYIDTISNLEIHNFQFLSSMNNNFYFHQKESSKINGNLIVVAPTGSGKTETAMLWLNNQLQIIGQGRAFYVLPFTASINAMYERLNEKIGEDKVGLIHGKLNDYINNYFNDFQYNIEEKRESIKKVREKFKNITTPLKIITPFQLIKNIYGLKNYEKGMFEWVGGYFIFDEIHAYDPKVFAQIIIILEFITKYLNSKVMIMTATLPSFLKNKIQHSIGDYTEIHASEELYHNFTRHKVHLTEGDISSNISIIIDSLNSGKKILVVCNTVKQAQLIFRELKYENSLLFHGYFNNRDRFIKEKQIMESDLRLLIGTQSIEVSLDIDYDIIYTEPAPLDALIQRFGRVNRKRKKGICDCFIFKKRNEIDKYVYKDLGVIERTIDSIKEIILNNAGIINEIELQKYIDFVYPNYNEESQKDFEITYKLLKESINELAPLIHSDKREEDFYKQFDGVPVLPLSLEDEYKNYLDRYDFISADSLMVKIKSWQFTHWINPHNDNLRKQIYIINSNDQNDKTIKIEYYLTNIKYSNTFGLIKNEVIEWNSSNNIF